MARPSRNEILLVCLILALAVNACCHVNSPVYKAYKELCTSIEEQQTEYYRAVNSRVVPAVTNAVAEVVRYRAELSRMERAAAGGPADAVPTSRDAATPAPNEPQYRHISGAGVCVVGGRMAVSFLGRCYFVGDSFLGAPICYIDGCSFGLVDGRKFVVASITGGSAP